MLAHRPQWRRKWKPAEARQRRTAAATLSDVFSGRPWSWLLPLLLALSLGVHAGGVMLSPSAPGRQAGLDELTHSQDSYLNKVMQKAKARTVSRRLSQRITMPPPPPDPEAVVNSTLSQEISTDIQKTVGKLLSVEVTGKLAAKVAANLKDELAAKVLPGYAQRYGQYPYHTAFREEDEARNTSGGHLSGPSEKYSRYFRIDP